MRLTRLAIFLLFVAPEIVFGYTMELASVGLRIADSEDTANSRGLTVVAVQKGNTAFLAGFQPGDLIMAIDKAPRLRAETVAEWLRSFDAGDKLGITWRFSVQGELADKPITTTLMVGLPMDGPWLEEIEVGPEAGRVYGGIRYYERFLWPDRAPAVGVVEAIQQAARDFPARLEQAEKQAAELPCDNARYRVIDELAKSLTVAYYSANGFINDSYKDYLADENERVCAATAAKSGGRSPCGPTPAAYQGKQNGDLLYALENGCERTLGPKEQLFMAGLGQELFAECHLPKNPPSRQKLERFLSASSLAAIMGREYSNPKLGDALADQATSSVSYAAGLAAFKAIGCKDPLAVKLAEGIVQYLDRTGGGRDVGDARFVEECVIYYKGRYTREQCQCVADVGRAVIPDIHQGAFSPVIIQSIIKRNPFLGLQLTSRCGLGNY